MKKKIISILSISILLLTCGCKKHEKDPSRSLQRIGMGLFLYATEHNGEYPNSLDDLVIKKYIEPELVAYPTLETPHGENKGQLKSNTLYIYLGAGWKISTVNTMQIIAYERNRKLQGGVNVLYGDGTVVYLTIDELDKQLKKQNQELNQRDQEYLTPSTLKPR